MSRRVVLIAAGLTILAGVAWGLWHTELGGSGPTRGPETESRTDAAAPRGPDARSSSGRSLAREAAPPPIEGATSRPRGERLQQPEATGAAKPSPAVVVARRALRDPSPEVRRSAVRELVRQDDRAAVRALKRLARRDPSPEVRATAEEGLRELGAEDAIAEANEGPAGPDEPSETRETPSNPPGPGGVDYDSMSTGPLVALLSDPDVDVREAAVDALGYNEHYDAIPDLWDAFVREPSWFVRDLILDALEDMDQEVDEPRELLYLQDEGEVDWDAIKESLQ
jgi:HEAT repeat protein